MKSSSSTRKLSTTLTSVVAVGAVGVAGFGTIAMYGTIAAATASHNAGITSTTPDTSGSPSGSSSGSSSAGTSGTQLLPGSGGDSHSRSSGS